jgi:hypothetical protein
MDATKGPGDSGVGTSGLGHATGGQSGHFIADEGEPVTAIPQQTGQRASMPLPRLLVGYLDWTYSTKELIACT